ncbi:hypothetical protein H0H81_000715 [Sphagnurus paluster]|uniref:Uncharacterized protein n=1 Tax=Sphagnurus paluster TaxID=117069 RepID=A0A9P7FPW4_9AGAR|nr:hypothetical protein H0H81_000715 [Sphagnurus paluster]
MRPTTSSTLLALIALPLLVAAQAISPTSSGSTSQRPSQTVITSTSVTTFVTLGPDRQLSTGVSTIVVTTTELLTNPPAGTNSPSPSGNATSTNSTTTPANLPTAPTTIAGGGGPAGAPSPGATGGAYGPGDGYIAAALALERNTMLVGFGGLMVAGALFAL